LIHNDVVRNADFSPDGRIILTASLDGTVGLWDATTHQPLNPNPTLRHSDRVTHAAFGLDGHRIVSSCIDGTVRIWDLAGGAVAPRPMHGTFSEDLGRFVTITNGQCRVWETLSSRSFPPLVPPPSTLHKAMLSRDGQFVITFSARGETPGPCPVEIWETATGQRKGPALSLTNGPSDLLVGRNGAFLLAFDPQIIQTWSVSEGKNLARRVATSAFDGASLNPEGSSVAAWSGGGLSVFSILTGQNLFAPLNHPFDVTHAEFSPDGLRLVSCGADKGFTKCYAQLWDASSGHPVGPRLYHGDGVVWATFSPDGSHIATAGEDFTAIVWDAKTGKQVIPGVAHHNHIWTVMFSANGRWVVTASSDKTARVWSAQTGDPLTPPLRQLQTLRSARFIGDDTRVVTVDRNGDASLWELPVETKPANDLVSLAGLLCGGKINPSLGLRPASSESIESVWRRLRANYPECFETSKAQISAWHEFEAQESALEGNWTAAAFHWQLLLQARPADPFVIKHCAEAQSKLNSSATGQ
jgi:WD40 repeat protein